MNQDRIDHLIQAGIAAGILPQNAARPVQDSRPWPVVLLTALGAWLSAIPLMIVIGIMVSDSLNKGAGPYFVGAIGLGAAVLIMRSPSVPFFVEQLALPILIAGGGLLAFGLFRDLPTGVASALFALTAIGVIWAVPKPWLRTMLGSVAAVFIGIACLSSGFAGIGRLNGIWMMLHTLLAIWLAAGWVQRHHLNNGATAKAAAAWECVSVGWLLVTLAGMAFGSGMSFLVGASMDSEFMRGISGIDESDRPMAQRAISAALALAAAAWMSRGWPALRQAWCAGAAAILVVLAWFMPSLGAVWLALAVCVSAARWRTSAAAGLAAAWIMGAIYYQLSWPLAEKSLLLAAAGALLGGLAWLGWRKEAQTDSQSDAQDHTMIAGRKIPAAASIGLSAVAVLLAANFGIWQKENLIAHGQPIYVELAPVDPRSLMQGDYMRLNFRLPLDTFGGMENMLDGARPRVIAKRDARGIASIVRFDIGAPLAADELKFELTPKNGSWTLVSDAWFFKEGEGERWARARYGEFRVDADGRALLVGLRGADLQAL